MSAAGDGPAVDRAALVAVGSELLVGGRRDGNGDWLTDRLGRIGVAIVRRTMVRDRPEEIEGSIAAGLATAPLTILTGGLGPTEDDRTREACAAALGVELERDPEQVRTLEARFRARGRRLEPHQARQADRPAGARWVENPLGSAPGFVGVREGASVVALPGVPAEMRAMFSETVEPWIVARGRCGVSRRTLRIGGLFESTVDRALEDLFRLEGTELTILAGVRGIELVLTARGRDASESEARLAALEEAVRARVGDDVFGAGDDTLASVLGRSLREAGHTVAVAESCTAGMLAAEITTVPGSSTWFRGGVVAYDDRVKTDLLGVPAGLIRVHGAVSEAVAGRLATGVRERLVAEIGVGVTGIAGPDGGSEEKPVGTVHAAVADAAGVDAFALRLPGDRGAVRALAVTRVLDRLWRRVRGR